MKRKPLYRNLSPVPVPWSQRRTKNLKNLEKRLYCFGERMNLQKPYSQQ
ncbi:unnamed protein product [Ranitomeya imitator]|uniref:Ribosomal protein S4 n=1 Tax=Ranitomeya imitator TaxID=111125 RepID=A0ABN9L2T1_9NEOB|nr:unnamed protein product [Ranitomeya imitator]